MIRSTMWLGAVLAGLASPAMAQDRRTDEAEAAAEQAEQAAADVERAARAAGAAEIVDPVTLEPAAIEPVDIVPVNIAPAPTEAPEVEPEAPVEWIAEPVVQPLGEPALPVQLAEPAAPAPVLALEEPVVTADLPDDATPPMAAGLAYAASDSAAPPARRPMQRRARRVQLAYTPEERNAWLAQCHAVYRGGYDCEGYLAHYEQAMGAASPGLRTPARTGEPAIICEKDPEI